MDAEPSASFDTENFITEIELRPALWNMNTEEYSNRELKRKNWEELVILFISKEDASDAEKNEYGRVLQRKWKSLRDCYNRERQRLTKIRSGSACSRRTPYMFYNQLRFLQSVVQPKNTSNSLKQDTDGIDEIEPEQVTPRVFHEERKGVKRKAEEKEKEKESPTTDVDKLVTVIRDGLQSKEEREKAKEEDDDRLFLLSLLNSMRRIPQNLRFSTRMQMMQVIDSALKGDPVQILPGQQSHHFNRVYMPHNYYDNTSQHSITVLNPSLYARPPPQTSSRSTVASPSSDLSADAEFENIF